MAKRLVFATVAAVVLVIASGCGSSTPTSPSTPASTSSSTAAMQFVLASSVNPASVSPATSMTFTASGCVPADGVYHWSAAGTSGGTQSLGTISLVPSLAVFAGQISGTYSVMVVASGCLAGTLTYTIPPTPPTIFTYTMAGMPDGFGVLVSSIPNLGVTVSCSGLSSNGQMACNQILLPGPTYSVSVYNSFTAQNDCKGLTASNGTLTIGTSATGCPAVFVR